MRTLRTTISFLTAASVLALPLMAAAAPIELTFRFNDAEQKEMREALDVFQKQSPNIKVTLQRIAWGDSREQFLREAAVGQEARSPDGLGRLRLHRAGDAGRRDHLCDPMDG